MNSIIESLNLWGGRFAQFAWPMLWQSSVLIAILFVLDFTLRRKVRAAVRYALWLVVMVKLLLPPTLAVPTSIAWWVRPNPPPKPQPQQYIVTHFNHAQTPTVSNLYEAFAAGALEVQHARLSPAGWFVTASGTIGVSLLFWMLLRWRHVARMVRAASPEAQSWNTMLEDGRRRIGLRRNVRLRLIDLPMSPAVCGLFRPVILLPRSLAEQLPPNQLRAVLLHELVHLKRGDVWVNCAQALLQIVYWWHPLLWLANARIRRLREDAVDDAVMLALREEAETYAPTLLEVAKLALNRPLASLGLVGIIESRSALRQRIERLTNFSAPRKGGLTVLSALGVVVFSALAVPMEKAPATSAKSVLPDIAPANPISEKPADAETNATAFAQSGKQFLEMGKLSEAEAELKKALRLDPETRPAWYYLSFVKEAQYRKTAGKVSPPATADARTNIIYISKDRQQVISKLQRIRLERIFYDNVLLEDVIRSLNEEVKKRDPDGRGVNFIVNSGPDQPRATVIDPSTGLPPAKNFVDAPDLNWPLIKINPALDNLALGDVLDIIVKVADKPIRYSIEDFGVVFSTSWPTEELFTRQFKLDRPSFDKWARYAAGIPPFNVGDKTYLEGEEAQAMHGSMRRLFLVNGVDLNAPKSVFYSNGKGILLVKASQPDLDTIQRLVEMWNTTSPPAVPRVAVPSLDNSSVRAPLAPAEKEPAASVEHPVNRFKSNSQSSLATNQFSASAAATETNATALVRSAKLLLEMGKLDEAEEELKAVLRLDPENQPAFYYWSFVKEARYRQADRLREQRSKGSAIQVEQDWSSSDFKNHLPVPNPFATNTLIWTGGRQSIVNKLNSTKLDSVFYDGLPLSEVVRNLSDETKKRDPLKKGLNFIINPSAQAAAAPPGPTAIDPSTGLPVAAPPAEAVDVGSIPVKINPALIDMRLADVLDIIVKVAGRPIKYSVEEWGIMFSLRAAEAQPLFKREFKWDGQSFDKWMRYAAGIPPSKKGDKTNLEGEEAQAMYGAVRGLFLINGVDLNPPKSVFYSHGAQALLANATWSDLEAIQRLVEIWTTTSPPAATVRASPASGETNATSDRATATPPSVRADKVPVLGDLPGLGKLFRSESHANRIASNGALRSLELTNAVPNGGGASRGGETTAAESNAPTSPVPDAELLHLGRFKVEPTRFCQGLQAVTGIDVRTSNPADVTRAMGVFLKIMGVNMDLPGRSGLFQEPTSELLVSATKAELEVVAKIIQAVNAAPPLVSIKVRFVEVPPTDGSGGFDLFLVSLTASNTPSGRNSVGAPAMTVLPKMFPGVSPQAGGQTAATQPNAQGQTATDAPTSQGSTTAPAGILTDPQYRVVLRALEQRDGVDLLNAPEVLTPSGRQAQIQIVDMKTVVTGVSAIVTNAQTNFVYKTDTVPFGSTLDVIPQVLLDGQTISMTVIPTVTEFLGYDDPTQITSRPSKEARPDGQLPLPRIRVRQITSSATVQDGQTLVLMNFPDQELTRNADGGETLKPFEDKKRRQLVVFVTPTLIDAAGNPLHPPQPTSR